MTDPDTDDLSDGQPAQEPKSAKPWLDLLEESERVYRDYQSKADNIDKLYADLDKLSAAARDREFQMFWANIQVLGPSIYSRPPVPVVVPRFKDRKPVPRTASEMLERSCIVTFETQDVDGVMRLIRDDLTILARGACWIRYETGKDYPTQKTCVEFADRKDFRHDPARTWPEVDWVAKASYLTKGKMRKRFYKSSKDAYKTAAYEDREDEETDDGKQKAKVWEIWCKSKNKVVWVAEGGEEILDEGEPHLKLEGFFPCPRPAYGTVKRRTLIPIPDVLFYKDQLEEINQLTARIGALTEALKVRGFYPAGAGEIGDAIETAIKEVANNQILIPISNWALLGNGAAKDTIVWLPIDQVATTIVQCVELRRQLIDDVYQITGLSDIMRGSTEASETLGAQELKSQYGSIRIRDRTNELVRIARDITRICAEIMAENFDAETLLAMSQLEVETDADIAAQIAPLEQQASQITAQFEAAMASPEIQAMAQQNPEQAQQAAQQAKQQVEQIEGQIEKLKQRPTIEKVMALLRSQRVRPYVLDIETDSTIAPDENATKQRATEFITALGGYINSVGPQVMAMPQLAPVAAEGLKYVSSQFRAGRQLEGVIEEFADQMKAMAGQPKPNPEMVKAESDAQTAQANAQKTQADAQRTIVEAQSKAAEDEQNRRIALAEAVDAARARSKEIEGKARLTDQDMANRAQKHQQDMDKGALEIEKLRLEIQGVQVKTAATVATTDAKIEQANQQTANAVATTEAGLAATEAKTEQSRQATDNSIATTNAGIAATERSTEIKAEQAKAKEPAL